MKKLNKTELNVIASRMAEEITQARTAEHNAKVKVWEEENSPKATEISKDLRRNISREHKIALTGSVKKFNDQNSAKEVLKRIRPNDMNYRDAKYESTYQFTAEILDELIVQQIGCPDVTALQNIVKKKFIG